MYQSDQPGIAKANRIAFAFACRSDDPRGDSFINDLRLSGAVKFLARRLEGFAHNARRVIVERAVAWFEERSN